MRAPERPRLAALVGWPLSHSRSALMHRIWAEREGANAYYAPVPSEPGYDSFARTVEALATLGFAGCNVTIPHKENALRFAASASDAAKQAGAANMLTFGDGGAHADNSDIIGFKASLEGAAAAAARGRALVLGAGGAARAVIVGLKELGYRDIVIANRTLGRSEELAERFGATVAGWDDREKPLAKADLLVNATSLGMKGEPALDIRLDTLPAGAVVADIVANPVETGLLAAARAKGHPTADGLTMLMHQAVPAYKAWLGRDAVVDADLRRRLEAAIAGTGR